MGETKFNIADLSITPIRAAANHRAEMVTQMHFGELYEILESDNYWHKIKLITDGYEGWFTTKYVVPVDEVFLDSYQHEVPVYSSGISHATSEQMTTIFSHGSRLPLYNDGYFYLGNLKMQHHGSSVSGYQPNLIMEHLKPFMGAPYLWGGKNMFGIDCSGFTQMVYRICGIDLPRDAYQQAELGETIASLADAKAGDLAFFAENGDRITHVGILTGNGTIAHVSHKVVVDKIDDTGIFNGYIKQYTLKCVLIKRYF
ncbi:MAG: C40 family peptidase [Bacteroidetes bacterium]|nr:C40 family peptidase [Bacteroidota bacterium]